MNKPDTKTFSLLCVANGRASTGYAWTSINQLYAAISQEAEACGMICWVSYWSVDREPSGTGTARIVELDARLEHWRSVMVTARFVTRERVRILYLTDQLGWRWAYTLFRLCGVRRIVVHNRTAYEPWEVPAWKRLLRRARRLIPGSTADVTVCVSEYVARKARHLGVVPTDTVVRLWNSVPPMQRDTGLVRDMIGVSQDRMVIACASRAHKVKGVQHLLRVFDRLDTDAVLVYCGDGPDIEEWKAIRDNLSSRARIHFLGYRTDATQLVGGADIAVVPSVYEEAFGRAALEPMAHGVPVIVSDVGGLPEVVAHEVTGLVVPPGDEDALASALARLISDPAERRRMGEAGIRRARSLFDRATEVDELTGLVFGPGSSMVG